MWQHLGHDESVHLQKWPEYDKKALKKDSVEIIIQINGKIKCKAEISRDISREEMEKVAMDQDKIKELVSGKNVVKVIAVPNKLVNIVVK